MAIYKGNQFIGVNAVKEKKVYVEVPEGSTIDDMSENNTIAIQPEEYAQLQDAVGYRVGDYTQRTISQMVERMKKEYFHSRNFNMFSDYQSTPWVRPQGWPNLDSLNLQMSGNDFIYMTYDNTRDHAAMALHIEMVKNGTPITVTIGHIENGTYIIDRTFTGTDNNYVYWFTNEDGDYPVIRVTGDILKCYGYSVTANGATQHHRRQPILERIAYVPHLNEFITTLDSHAWGCFSLQREKFNNGDGSALKSLYGAWGYCRNLKDLDISGLKTQNVTNMSQVFRQALKLTELDLRHFNVEKVTTFNSMFDGCRALKTIDLRGWNTLAVTNIGSMFNTCLALIEIKGIENIKTDKVTTLSGTFAHCRSIKTLDLTKWNTEKVTTLYACFNSCYSLIELDLSHWNVNKVTSLSSTFSSCYSLKRIDFTGWQTGILTTIYSIFGGCQSLEYIDISWLNVTTACLDVCYAFQNCWSVKELNLNSWDLSAIPDTNNRCHDIFANCYSVKKITGITNWNCHSANSMAQMFYNCYCLEELNISNWDVSYATNLGSMFQNCYNLRELNLSNWQISNCTNISNMFNGCNSLLTVGDISQWDTSQVTTMSGMFRYCYSLRDFPQIQNWDFSKVTSLANMFAECTSLTTVTWTNVNLPLCTSIEALFRYDYNLEYANLSGWSTPSVVNNVNYYQTLGDCWLLRDLIGFPIPSTYTNIGFQNCDNLSYESLLRIFNALPQVTGTHTIRIPAIALNALTKDEKAIATGKNWTLSNS